MTADKTRVVVLWLNPGRKTHPQSRLLQSLCSTGTPPVPFSFDYSELRHSEIAQEAIFVSNRSDFYQFLPESTKESPIIATVQLLEEILGWDTFKERSLSRG